MQRNDQPVFIVTMPAVSAAGFTEIGVVDTPDGAALLMRATRRNAP